MVPYLLPILRDRRVEIDSEDEVRGGVERSRDCL